MIVTIPEVGATEEGFDLLGPVADLGPKLEFGGGIASEDLKFGIKLSEEELDLIGELNQAASVACEFLIGDGAADGKTAVPGAPGTPGRIPEGRDDRTPMYHDHRLPPGWSRKVIFFSQYHTQ